MERAFTHKKILRIVLITVGILLIPLVAMQFTDEVDWGVASFFLMGTLLIGSGLSYEFLASKVTKRMHKVLIGFAVLIVLFLIWAELAVDLVTRILTTIF